jgi:hypothetical protein
MESMAKGVLMGWKNLGFQGTALPDTWDYATAKKLLAVKDFRALVSKHADSFAEYKAVQEEADAKNS